MIQTSTRAERRRLYREELKTARKATKPLAIANRRKAEKRQVKIARDA